MIAGSYMLPRVLLAYLLVPVVPPAVMFLVTGMWRMDFGSWFGIVVFYEGIGFAAMVLLGTPLLLFYRWRGRTGWGAFVLGGAVCAAFTAGGFLYGSPDVFAQTFYFTTLGMLAGLVFRFVLYGFRKVVPADISTERGGNSVRL